MLKNLKKNQAIFVSADISAGVRRRRKTETDYLNYKVVAVQCFIGTATLDYASHFLFTSNSIITSIVGQIMDNYKEKTIPTCRSFLNYHS